MTNLSRKQKEALAWELQCAIVNGLGGECGDTAFGGFADDEVHPVLGMTWNQATREISTWLDRMPGGITHRDLIGNEGV